MKEIKITEIENIRIGSAEDKKAGTGCTVIICERGAAAGLDVRGGGPASRESELLKPMAAADVIQAVLLSGGSAFGLDAAGGVMEYLEERGIGFDVGITKVPLVCESCLFDLMVGDYRTRPDKAMGYAACEGAEKNNYQDGNFGAGTGASVGKLGDKSLCMKGGIGSYAVQIGDLKVGAVVAVNARGDIYDWKDGKKVAGLLNADRKTFADTEEAVYKSYEVIKNKFTGATENTTIGAVITNAAFPKSSLCKIAGMAHDGYARAIRPVHTSSDGDSIYALSVGDVKADQDMVGTLGAQVMAEAILRAVRTFAKVKRTAVWISCPQACITPGTSDLNGRSFSSSTGSASMSARNAMHGPGFSPFMTATVLVPEIPSISGMPREFRVLRM